MMKRISRVARALFQAFHAVDTPRRIRFSRTLYFHVPDLKLKLLALAAEDSQSAELSIPEMKILFQSIRSAYELREIRQIKVGNLLWTTDGRTRLRDPEHMIIEIEFDGTSGSTRTHLDRRDVAAALDQFETKLISAL